MRPCHSAHWFKKIIINGFLVTFLSSLVPMGQVADALSIIDQTDPSVNLNPGGSLSEIRKVDSIETRYGLVAILVEDSLWDASTSGRGFFSFLGTNGIKEKIQTYAQDVQATLPWTKTVIIEVADEDTPVEIQRMLERFYFEGNPEDSDPTKLSGVVIIGDVPLPVVNKGGNRFISMLPYTDFEEPSYLLDSATLDFLPNGEAQHLQTEVWHGLIVPPLDGQEGIDLLGAFFEKNHAFHTGDEDYTTFDKKAFIGDLVTEESTINPTAFGSYERFVNLWEEISYYRYTNDLVEELFTDMQTSVQAGDFLDNDGDGIYDEEAANGIDDDGDGLVDEDIGDGFFGIDNDGDCYGLAASAQDSNGDGKPCFGGQYDENGEEILPPDNLVDEDGFDDNNNDADWVYEGYAEGDALFADRMVDEDPPGDTTGGEDSNGDGVLDGDGCPGLCGVDDNGDSTDHDGDGYPTGIELLFGWDWTDEKEPWGSVRNWTNDFFGTSYEKADKATTYLQAMFVDQFFDDDYKSPTCYFNGVYHPEYDDDEDGFCDEDGSTEMQIWKNSSGTFASGTCTYNDADCDGEIDEDPSGLRPEGLFDDLPDIQGKNLVEGLTSRYAEMFDQPQGIWNRLVDQTGRYKTRSTDGEKVTNDYDTAISLISKKDELTLNYLYELNTELEEKTDGIVKENLAEDIPIIAGLQITGEMTPEGEDAEPEAICDPDKKVTKDGACLQFVNHSGFDNNLFDSEGELEDLDDLNPSDYFISGQNLWDIDSPEECTSFAGTDVDGGQLVQFNTLYSREFTVENDDMTKSEVMEYRNCVPEYEPYTDDIPEVCAPAVVTKNIRVLDGAKTPDEGLDTSGWETGAGACFEFRELETFNDYTQSMAEFNNWLTKKIRKFRKDGADDEASYEEFLAKVEEKRNSITPKPNETTLRAPFDGLDIIAADEDRIYTLEDLLIELGYSEPSNDDIDTFIALENNVSIDNPRQGSRMSDIAKLDISFDKLYLEAGTEELTTKRSAAQEITSYYKHVEPTGDTLNAQAENTASPNLPIDKTRYVSFIDSEGTAQNLDYVNVFGAESVEDVEAQVDTLAEAVNNVAGGSGYKGDVEAFYDSIDEGQLQDALEWRFLSIDEKHKYVMSHFLGEEEPFFSKARDGYEMVSLIADGTATEMNFVFNGDMPETEEDLEFLYRSQAEIDAALAAAAEPEEELEPSEANDTTPVLLGEWITEIQHWLEDIQDTFSSMDNFEGEKVCGENYVYDSASNEDSNDNGIPDGADASVSLLLTSDNSDALLAGGGFYHTVSVAAKQADGTINTADNYTQVDLDVVSGGGSITVAGSSTLTLTGGVAIFTLESADPGSFVVRGVASNRDDVINSNTLSGTVESKFIKLSSFIREMEGTDGESTVEEGTRIQVKDSDGNVRATLDPESGDLELRDAEAELREASEDLPTRVAIVGADGITYGTFFLIPEKKEDVLVEEVGDTANVASDENGIALEDNSVQIGLVTAMGQIALVDGYTLTFDNPGEINIYDPLHVLNGDGETIFMVTIKHSFTEGNLLTPEGDYSDYLSFDREKKHDWNFSFLPLAKAASESVIPDTDGDLLDDLEEFVIGTLQNDNDSDSDTFLDGLEVFSGYDPLRSGKKLFTDIGVENKAYPDLIALYLRGVIKGYSDGSFRPDNPITREEFVKIDLGAICKDCDSYNASYETGLMTKYSADPFPDNNINPELLACVAEAKMDGIVSGYAGGSSAGFFLPTKNISRAEATKVLVETAGYEVAEVSSGSWYSEYAKTAEKYNLFPDGVTADTSWLEGSITRGEFVMMAVNLIEEKDCRAVDSDGEGLSDMEEQVLYGTDSTLADTDGGGVNDLDEILRGSDPLDASDDFPVEEVVEEEEQTGLRPGFDHEPGLYVVSNTAGHEEIAVSGGESSASVDIFTNDIPADGVSEIYVRAEIRDQEDNLYGDDNSSVIEFILSTDDYGEIDSDRVQVSGGVAETKFTTTKVAGDVTVEGRITDGSLPSQNAEIHVYPGDPVRLDLQGESSILPAGAEAATDMRVYLYDAFGNLASNGFYPVTFTTEGGITLLDLKDEDVSTDGVQVTTADGYIDFRVLASSEVETASVQVSIPEIVDSGDSFSLRHRESLSLKILITKPYLFAGSSSGESIVVSVVDELGLPITGFQGDVLMSLSDPGYGSFETETLTLVDGSATTTVNPGTLAGMGSIIAESAGISGGSANLVLKPADIYELRVRKEDDTFVMDAGEQEKFIIEGYDVYGNLVTTDSATNGTVRLTDSTAEYGSLSSSTFTLNQGVASVYVTTGEVSGKISLVASSTGLLAGTWGGSVDYSLSGEEFQDMDLQMLYASLLGGPFGDVTQENYVAGWMTFNGKTQAMTSLISEPKPKKRLATIDANGAVTLPEDGMVTQVVEGAGSELPMRIQWRAFPDDTLLAEIFAVLGEASEVTAELVTTDDSFTLEESGGVWVLREDAAAVVKVRADGQVILVDPTYTLAVNGAAAGLGLVVSKNTEQIIRVDYAGNWAEDVNTVDSDFNLEDWDTLDPGIYLRPTAASENRIVTIPTGNSSMSPMGLAIIDPEKELDKAMQPSLGYTSLEGAEDNGDIGWEGENKHLLLFAAGNTVGQSNLYYPSEVGVVLGDPTVSIPTEGEVGSLGFTTDVGTQISTSNSEILTLLDIDYNGDGLPDVLTAYEDGRIEVLQNAKADVRLQNRGELLYIENGISSVDKGDFNNDGLEDLLIATKEACYEGEMCLYEYENTGGGFTATNLNLSGITGTPTQVEVGDLNGDNYDDIVLVDENMVLYIVWNSEGVFEDVDTIKDFGLNTDSSVNLYADLVLHYDGLENGSVSLPILTSDFSADANLDTFLSALGVDEDIETSTENVQREVNQSFEYANNDSLSELFTVTKTVNDPSGGDVEVGDVLTYSVTVKNISGGAYSDVYLSDSVGSLFRFDEDSFTGATIGLQAGEGNRPFIYGPLSLNNGESLSFTYDVSVESLPALSVMLGNDFYSDYKDDNYMDIAVSPANNASGELLVFYSDGYATEVRDEGFLGLGGSSYRHINYQERAYSPATYAEEYDTTVDNPFGDADGDGTPDFMENMDANKGFPVPTDGSFDPIAEVLGGKDTMNEEGEAGADGYYSTEEMFDSDEDVDGDGINDIIDNWVSGSDIVLDSGDDVILSEESDVELEANINALNEEVAGVADKIEKIVSMFTCNGGCIAFPGSVAFLAPGFFHVPGTGVISGFDPGTPVFGILPYLPVVCTGQACYGSQVLRLYLAPTTTLGLGLGVCLGPYGAGQCFAFSIPLLQTFGICDAINSFISDSMSKATSFVTSTDGEAAMNLGDTLSVSTGSTGLESTVFTSYVPPVAVNTNVQVPGFPSIFTEWWKAQKEEFFKMLDLPDVTFIYPDPKSLTTKFSGGNDVIDLDQKTKIEELTSGTLGLEKWLNMAHALPLIDIKPETVNIRYPALTREEIEIVMRDAQDWVADTKKELQDFKDQFDVRDDLTAAQQEVVREIVTTLEEAITAVETNMAILESYTEIPEQILKIRELEAYYAKTIICYIDAILSHTSGYLKENTERIEAWGQWIVDLQKIVDGWQVLIDLSMDLMDSCDKCTNQRYSGMQLLFSLFVFVPEFPVVEMPKLPDIIIDVSNIQAGIDVVWPDINFIPERINIPALPRIILPDVDIKLDAKLDLDLNIPTLPVFDINFELPELPPLSLPNLPSLPPPPAIPELDPTLSAALNISSNILRIVCIIRQGFIPTSEFTLKSKIEDITERSGGIVLPADLAVEVEWPKFNYDFMKEIRVNTYLNLTLDFSALYDLIAGLGEKSDEMVTDLVQEGINRPLEEFQNKVQDVFDILGEQEIDVEVDAEVDESSYNEAMDTAEAYKDNPLVMQNLVALRQIMENLQVELDAWDQDMPETVTLTAEPQILALDDPLLNRYDEVLTNPSFDKDFLASIEGTPLTSLVQLRDSLITYTEDFDQGTLALHGMDSESFQRYLAQENVQVDYLLASDESDQTEGVEQFVTPDEDLADAGIELASEIAPQAQTFSDGLYLYDAELGISERLTDYTQEADEASSILFIDLDGDGDEDIVYSMGGDTYFKENHTEEPTLNFVSSDPAESTVSEMDPLYGSIQNFKRGKNDYQEASFSFSDAEAATGYEVLFYDSLDAQEADPNENIKRLLLLADEENENSTFTDTAGKGVGQIRNSRLWADSVSGKVKLQNAYKRTLITNNGEIEVEEAVTFQTVEDSVIEFTIEDSTSSIDVPAGQVVTFGQNQDRLLRVESGSVYWIEQTETVEEQDLEEGMEIFPEEIVALQSSGADATLATSEGAEIKLDKEEIFAMDRLTSADDPSANIELENGAYYTLGHSLQSDGSFGTLSDNILLNPQVCADDSEPYTLIDDGGADTDGDGAIEIAIFSTKELSAEGSFDSDSEIVDAYWDLDSGVDNDQVFGLTAEIGPYEDVNDRMVTLYVTDSAGNTAKTEIAVEVYVPTITIADATSTAVSGVTDPASPVFPFHLVRDRSGAVNEIGTGYSTDENGEFMEEMMDSNLLSVYDSEGGTIAEFNPATKQVMVYDPAYDVAVLPSDADWPSRLAVYEKSLGAVVGSFLFVANANAPIQQVAVPLDTLDLSLYSKVTVYPVADKESYEFGDDVLLARDEFGALDFMVNQSGNITIFDDRYTLVRRDATSLDDYLIIEVYDGDALELEIWPGTPDAVHLVTTDDLNLPASDLLGDGESLSADYRLYFEDIKDDDPLYQDIAELVERNVLEGYTVEDQQYFKPNQAITRAEFTKIILGILCIIPSDAAHLLPSVFSDILDVNAWYYAYTKESSIRDLITGYLGELNAAGMAPFKPNNTITRAEAAKIVLEALDKENIITLPDDLSGVPWYEPYMEIAQDLTPYMTGESTAGETNFIVTDEEAADPNHKLTRYEFVEMSVRVLKAYNCFDLDSDGDGLINYDEEGKYYTDPYNPDTDSGGVDDGSEVNRGSDPLDSSDDFGDGSLEGVEPGIYAVREPCSACPCISTIDYNADLRPGDNVFAIIQNAAGEIFGVSNTVTVEK
ncbi:MAG: S-layer homology domain-containing protein [Candidatus Gracilibacteria bacterium]